MYENDVFFRSTRKNKKWMVEHNGKMVHFGDSRYLDFTQHGDLERRRLFRIRNARWKDAPLYSPASLSYFLLW
jgi:hypothetical protein